MHLHKLNKYTLVNTFAAGSAPAWERVIDLTLEGRRPAVNALKWLNFHITQVDY